MKTQLQLNSVVLCGVGSSAGSKAIELIYAILLNRFLQNQYSCISINQIGNELKEFISKNGRQIHININYPTYEDFNSKSVVEKNRIRLDVIHEALIRIAQEDKKLDIAILEEIKNEILKNNFSFNFIYKTFKHKKKDLLAEIIVHPEIGEYKFYVLIKESGIVKCNLLIYVGKPGLMFDSFFSSGSWKNDKEITITGKEKQVEIHINVDTCEVDYLNLTNYKKAPLFQMMRANLSREEEEIAREDWIHSLPPAIASVIRDAKN